MERQKRTRGVPKKVYEGPLTVNKLNTYMSALTNRAKLASRLGVMTYSGDRDLYQALGYPKTLTFRDFYLPKYMRHDIAKAIIDRPVRAAWRGGLTIHENGKKGEESEIETKWNELEERFQFHSKLMRLDKLTGIGHYGVLLLGLNDVTTAEDMAKEVKSGSNKLVYVKPLSEGSAKVNTWENDPNNERFGKPVIYQVTVGNDEGQAKTINVHHTRIIHIVEDVLEDESKGTPRLEAVFNRLLDLEKIIGGDAEMYWRGARPGYKGKVDKDYQLTTGSEADIQDQFDEYENNLRRFLLLEGVDVNEMEQQIGDPRSNVDVQIQMISAVTGIPKRILLGSERGELSSAQDKEEWNLWVQSRREEFMEPQIVRPIVDRFMKLGILPKVDSYLIHWDELFAMSPSEKSEIAERIANAIRYYTATPTAEYILPKEIFLRKVLGLTKEELEEAERLVNALPPMEPDLTPEEKAEMNGGVVGSPLNGTGKDTVAKKQKA